MNEQLQDMKARLEAATPGPPKEPNTWEQHHPDSLDGTLKLVSALKAVESLLSSRQKLWDAICAETCAKGKYGVDHEAIADEIAAQIQATILEALA